VPGAECWVLGAEQKRYGSALSTQHPALSTRYSALMHR